MTVYVLITDYESIRGVFSTREKAEACLVMHGMTADDDDITIADFILDVEDRF